MVKIRKATHKDFKEIAEIIKEEYGKQPYKENWTRANAFKTLNYYLKFGREIYVAEIYGEVAGVIIIQNEYYNKGPQSYIEEFAVLSKFQGNGIGTALLKKAESRAKERKATKIYLSADVKAPARGFYEKMGYKSNNRTLFFGKMLRAYGSELTRRLRAEDFSIEDLRRGFR